MRYQSPIYCPFCGEAEAHIHAFRGGTAIYRCHSCDARYEVADVPSRCELCDWARIDRQGTWGGYQCGRPRCVVPDPLEGAR
jgi:transposase-like protein